MAIPALLDRRLRGFVALAATIYRHTRPLTRRAVLACLPDPSRSLVHSTRYRCDLGDGTVQPNSPLPRLVDRFIHSDRVGEVRSEERGNEMRDRSRTDRVWTEVGYRAMRQP